MSKRKKKVDWSTHYQKYHEKYLEWGRAYRAKLKERKLAEKAEAQAVKQPPRPARKRGK